MRKLTTSFFIFLCIFSSGALPASDNVKCYDIHPNSYQEILAITTFQGDRHGDFSGNPLVILQDNSTWKIHPEDMGMFSAWEPGNVVRIGYRTSTYWFKREHKYFMYNVTRKEEARVMLITHQAIPQELCVVAKRNISGIGDLLNFFIDYNISIWPTRNTVSFTWQGDYRYFNYNHVFCVVSLSDGSLWFLINRHSELKSGSKVYIGTQFPPRVYDKEEKFYVNNPDFNFFFILGDQREASTCRAYPLFPR